MLSRSGIHAIRAMVALAILPPRHYCGVPAIAASTRAPRNYLGKLLLLLSRRGLVESRKGLGGGFRLSRRADQITLLDVISAIEDVGRWTDCMFAGSACSETTPCMAHERWNRAHEALLSFLNDTSIGELAMHHPQMDCVSLDSEAARIVSGRS
jgi:Rrf2 family protein